MLAEPSWAAREAQIDQSAEAVVNNVYASSPAAEGRPHTLPTETRITGYSAICDFT
jgi:hypothetical protein